MKGLLRATTCALAAGTATAQCFLAPILPATQPVPQGFGLEVTVAHDLVIAGSGFESVGGADFAGAAYVYELGPHGLGDPFRLTATDPFTNQSFGRVHATDGVRIAIASSPSSPPGAPWRCWSSLSFCS